MIAAALVDLDLTSAELNALANVYDAESLTVSQLGAAMGIRPTTLTSVLDRLERRGHLTREHRGDDRRAVVIELTEVGRDAAALVRNTIGDLERDALRGVARRDVAGFTVVLAALTEWDR